MAQITINAGINSNLTNLTIEVGKRYINSIYDIVLIVEKTEQRVATSVIRDVYRDTNYNAYTSQGEPLKFEPKTKSYELVYNQPKLIELDSDIIEVGENYITYKNGDINTFIHKGEIKTFDIDGVNKTLTIGEVTITGLSDNKIKQFLKALKV